MENKFDGSRMAWTATEVGMRATEAFELLRPWREQADLTFTAYINTFWSKPMTEKKAKQKTLTQSIQDCHNGLTAAQSRMDAQSRLIDNQTDRINLLTNLVTNTNDYAELVGRIRKLEQQHCSHDFEIVGGCISDRNRIYLNPYPQLMPRTVTCKCVKCGLTVDKPLDITPEPKKTVWKRFTLFFRWGHD